MDESELSNIFIDAEAYGFVPIPVPPMIEEAFGGIEGVSNT